MRAVRYLLRVGVLMLVGVAVFCGLVLLLNAQVLLNRYAELYMMDTESSSAAVLNRINGAANDESAFASATSEPVRARNSPASEPQAPSPAILAKSEPATAIHVSNVESIADVAASDRWVDVVLTHQPGTSAAFSEVVLENVKVLTIEPADSDFGEQSAVHAVTFDVDTDTAQNLLLASHSGRLSLVLRRPGDNRAPVEANQASIPEAVPNIPELVTSTPGPVTSLPEPATSVPKTVTSAPEPVASAPVPVTPQPTAVQDDPGFTVVTVNRVGGTPSTYRVPRER